MQFLMAAYNLLENKTAYLNTGTWSDKAIKEAKIIGDVVEVATSRGDNFNFVPKNYRIPDDVDYFHCTSNNTIYGTQLQDFPNTSVPIVCDMSSDIFSRELDFSKFGLIYAGAQKNMGPAGVALVVIKEEILGKTGRIIPNILDYQEHIRRESMYNTPAVFAVYTSLLTLKWLQKKGGIKAIEKLNNDKAKLLYDEIDRNPLFVGTAQIEDR